MRIRRSGTHGIDGVDDPLVTGSLLPELSPQRRTASASTCATGPDTRLPASSEW
ncbi:hypothetical protein [Streptomyces sp. NPDC056690]|uniref:hypothetical protein n=1 Tax=unclassified Streptomyces TaxID=2593676 RepID=UPI003638C356